MRDDRSWTLLKNTLEKSLLFPSKIDSFNDPFEAKPVVIGRNEEKIEINATAPANTEWSPIASPIFKRLHGKELTAKEIIEGFRSSLSMICFSRRINSGLLWGHYTSGYRGVALHFSPTNDIKSPFQQGRFHWVNYEKQRPYLSFDRLRYYFNRTLSHPAGAFTPETIGAIELQFMSSLLTWKSEEWSYEQEARLIISSETTEITFPPEELLSIVLGPLCTEVDEKRVRTMVSDTGRSIKIARASLSGTDYSIEIDW